MEKISPEKILQYMQDNGMVNVEDVLSQIETMKNQEILNQHPYAISQGSNKRWYTYLPDISKPNGRRQIANPVRRRSKRKLYNIIDKGKRKKLRKNFA